MVEVSRLVPGRSTYEIGHGDADYVLGPVMIILSKREALKDFVRGEYRDLTVLPKVLSVL